MKIYWRRIRVANSADKHDLETAKKAAERHAVGKLKELEFTEKNFEWVLLYDHIRLGQITPRAMRNMRRRDLYYLAGLTFPHPALLNPKEPDKEMSGGVTIDLPEKRWTELTKIQGNAIRAKEELKRRNFIWSSALLILAALSGAMVGAYLGR